MEHLSAGAVDLVAHLLQPNPAKRARLFETMGHPWITRDGLQPLEPYKQPAIDHSLQTAVSTSGMWFVRMHSCVYIHNHLFSLSVKYVQRHALSLCIAIRVYYVRT